MLDEIKAARHVYLAQTIPDAYIICELLHIREHAFMPFSISIQTHTKSGFYKILLKITLFKNNFVSHFVDR